MSSERAATAALLALLAAGCNIRDLTLEIHAPEECPVPLADGGLGPEPMCPLEGIGSFRTELARVDGLIAASECMVAPAALCTYEDLTGYNFLQRSESSEGVEIRIVGYDDATCGDDGGEQRLACETFGESVIDLTSEETSTPIWCDCPRFTTR